MFWKRRGDPVKPHPKEEAARKARGELAVAINELDRTKHRLETLMADMLEEVNSVKRHKHE